MRNQSGFSKIDILIVLLVVGIITVIAIPNLQASRHSANAGSAVAVLRNLHHAQITYSQSVGSGDFAGDAIGTTRGLQELVNNNLIERDLEKGIKDGYEFVGGQTPSDKYTKSSFWFSAVPSASKGLAKSGSFRLGITDQGIIKGDTDIEKHFSRAEQIMAADDFSD